MNTSLFISSGALQAYQQKLDTSANNIANVNTMGYKKRDQSFSELLASQINNQNNPSREVGRITPNGIRVGYGTKAGLTQLDMEQGQAVQTDNPFDLMIQGKGLFQVAYPGDNQIRYTRDGNFHLSPDPAKPGSFNLVHANGGVLLDQNGKPIELDERYDVSINPNGEIQLKNKDGNGAAFSSAQRVGIVDIQNPHLLRNTGDNEYTFDTTAIANGTNPLNYVRMMTAGEVQVQTGALEGSNVDLSQEMTDLMTTQRGFQMNARAVSYADQMMGIANSILK